MHIIFGQDVADDIRQKHLVLELETFVVNDIPKTAYCVVPSDKIPLVEMPDLDRVTRLHETLIGALNRNDWNTVVEGITHLQGKFGGELDSFYTTLLEQRVPGDKIGQK